MSQREQVLENKLKRAESAKEEYKRLYDSVVRDWDRLHTHIERQQRLINAYQKWFEYNKNWTRRHNEAIKWNIEEGRPDNWRVLKVDKEIEDEREKAALDEKLNELLSPMEEVEEQGIIDEDVENN